MSPAKFTTGMNRAFGRRPCIEKKVTRELWCAIYNIVIARSITLDPQGVPFQEILPLALKDSLSGKGEKSSNVACLQEMAVMFACLKKNDFSENHCQPEISSFQSCFTKDMKLKKQLEQNAASDSYVGVKTKLPYLQVNKLLQKYPQS